MGNTVLAPPKLFIHTAQPLNAETPLAVLRHSFETAADAFYVRNHGAVPEIAEGTHRVVVGGLVATPLELSVAELKRRFAAVTVRAVLQCAGNRRGDLQAVRKASGTPWAAGAIGNAAWTGVRLRDVLRMAGVEDRPGLHVAFDAADTVEVPGEAPFAYGVSIPLEKAMAAEVLLAWAMGGEALTPAHGFPLRVVVPGYAGVRSPKWLTGITVQDRPSGNHMQQRDYKLLPPDVVGAPVDWDRGATIDAMPLNAAICEPAAGAGLRAGRTVVRGYAVASERDVSRVDVSADGGERWQQAALETDGESRWCWTFWETAFDLAAGEHELVVRAWDGAGQTQPGRLEDVWNVKGYLCAAWHRVRVHAHG